MCTCERMVSIPCTTAIVEQSPKWYLTLGNWHSLKHSILKPGDDHWLRVWGRWYLPSQTRTSPVINISRLTSVCRFKCICFNWTGQMTGPGCTIKEASNCWTKFGELIAALGKESHCLLAHKEPWVINGSGVQCGVLETCGCSEGFRTKQSLEVYKRTMLNSLCP